MPCPPIQRMIAPSRSSSGGVKPRRGLVEHDRARTPDQGARHFEKAPLSKGEAAHIGIGELSEADEFKDPSSPPRASPPRCGAARRKQAALEAGMGADQNILAGRTGR